MKTRFSFIKGPARLSSKVTSLCFCAALWWAAASQCLGQGMVHFLNNDNCPVQVKYGETTYLASKEAFPTIRIALYWGPAGSTANQLLQISPTGIASGTTNGIITISSLRAGCYVGGMRPYVTGEAPGSCVFQVRAWDSTYGATWEDFCGNSIASSHGAVWGASGLITSINSTSVPYPPLSVPCSDYSSIGTITLTGSSSELGSFVPEPGTFALAGLAIGVVWFARRAKLASGKANRDI